MSEGNDMRVFSEQTHLARHQNPDIGYLIIKKNDGQDSFESFPLYPGKYVIGRSRNPTILKTAFAGQEAAQTVIWIPKSPGPSTVVPVARLQVRDNQTEFLLGWLGKNARDIISIERYGETHIIQNGRCQLHGFETISLSGNPPSEMWYVPPINQLLGRLTPNLLKQLEEYSLWASAALGWEGIQQYNRALAAWDKAWEAVQNSQCGLIERANVLFGKARTMSFLSFPIGEILTIQMQACKLMGLPYFSCKIDGKISEQGVSFQQKLFVKNGSQVAARDLKITYHCDELGIYKTWKLENQLPRDEDNMPIWVKSIHTPGRYPVEIGIEFTDTAGVVYEYILEDYVLINRKRSIVDIAGMSGRVDIDVEHPDHLPDIRIGQDSAIVKIKIHKSNPDD